MTILLLCLALSLACSAGFVLGAWWATRHRVKHTTVVLLDGQDLDRAVERVRRHVARAERANQN